MQIIIIYILLEIVEFITIKDSKNAYSYIMAWVTKYQISRILFFLNHLSFFYILFLIVVLKIYSFSIIIAGIFKFFDILVKLWFVNNEKILNNFKGQFEDFQMNFWIKALSPISYILLIFTGIILFKF